MATTHILAEGEWARARAIRLRALRDCPDAFGDTLERERRLSEEDWRRRLRRTDAVNVVATHDGHEDIGLIVGAPYGDDAGLFSMWVAPEARRCGVGGLLVDAVVAWARQARAKQILLDVGDWNAPAIGLYASKGFHPTGAVGTLPPPREHITEHQRARIL